LVREVMMMRTKKSSYREDVGIITIHLGDDAIDYTYNDKVKQARDWELLLGGGGMVLIKGHIVNTRNITYVEQEVGK